MTRLRGLFFGIVVAGMAAGCMPATPVEGQRLIVYFDEMSANITPQGAGVIADAAAKATATHATAIRIEGRASATGTPEEGHRLAEARVQAVSALLQKDGLDPKSFRQVYVGQTGSGDTSVADRRVDIVLER